MTKGTSRKSKSQCVGFVYGGIIKPNTLRFFKSESEDPSDYVNEVAQYYTKNVYSKYVNCEDSDELFEKFCEAYSNERKDDTDIFNVGIAAATNKLRDLSGAKGVHNFPKSSKKKDDEKEDDDNEEQSDGEEDKKTSKKKETPKKLVKKGKKEEKQESEEEEDNSEESEKSEEESDEEEKKSSKKSAPKKKKEDEDDEGPKLKRKTDKKEEDKKDKKEGKENKEGKEKSKSKSK